MYPIKSLILLFNKPLYLLLVLILFVAGCNNLAQKPYVKQVYVNSMYEKEGMLLKHSLLSYFPNKDYNKARYVLDALITKSDDLYLTNKNNFGTKGRIRLSITWSILDKTTKKIILSITSVYYETYTVEPTGTANRQAIRRTLENLSVSAAKDIALKAYMFLERYESDEAAKDAKKSELKTEAPLKITSPQSPKS